MCGIAGIIGSYNGAAPVKTMLECIRHRGPDGLFYWDADRVSFGHARLSIIDLSSDANQPMEDAASGNVIIFNGEIYNYREIKKEIGPGYAFKTNSDTEVILAAYSVFGIAFLEKLQGMFAFALYDQQQKKVLLARDRVGIKPFYYCEQENGFYFASEIKSLLLPGFTKAVNEKKLYEFIADRQLDSDTGTFFENIYQLPAAHYMWVDDAGKPGTCVSYWDIPVPGEKIFDENAKAELVGLFDETVHKHLRADVAIGSFLSGGIDSTSVTCFAVRNMQQEKLHVFSGILPYHHPENSLIEGVCKSNEQLSCHRYMMDGSGFFEDIYEVIYQHDEPILDGSMYSHYKLCELAGQSGIKVLLSGSGGDELFGGYGSYIYAYLASLITKGAFGKFSGSLSSFSGNTNYTKMNLLLKSLYEALPVNTKNGIKRRQLKNRARYLSISPLANHYKFTDKDPYTNNLYNNYKSWTVPPYLHYEDRNSMRFGVEIRVPFYDHILMAHVLQYDPGELLKGSTKNLLRTSFKGIVPAAVLEQKGKYGFPSSIDHALATDEAGKEIFYRLLKSTPYLKQKETAGIAKAFYAGDNTLLTVYWRILSYMIWYDIFFNKNYTQTAIKQ